MRKYETEIKVIYADTDAMGIVYHTNYIKWFEIGRNEYLRDIGYPYSRLEKEGIWLPVAAVTCEYKATAKYDDVLLIQTRVDELKAATIILKYDIFNKSTGKLLVTGSTKHAITNPELKIVRLKKVNSSLFERILQDI